LYVHFPRLVSPWRSTKSMPEFSLPDTAYKRILGNPRNSQRLRLAALKAMSRPPLMFLMRLERDPETPDRLRFAIAQRRELETLVRKAKNVTLDTGRSQDDPAIDCR
jgi:hypothetical protein